MPDAILIVSFGGPERREDVLPFLENVVAGRNVPRERLLEVAEHYYHFGGKSPLNDHNRALIAALEALLREQGPALPVYWGNRNWRPYLADAIAEMRRDGIQRAFAFATSAFGSYSGCRQYREDLERARAQAGAPAAADVPEIRKLRLYYNHPGFLDPMTDRVRAALEQVPAARRARASVVFTAHSIPLAMARVSPYESQLTEICQLVSKSLGLTDWKLAYQSRSGPVAQPWLEPDILDYLRSVKADGEVRDVVVAPIGFVSDHLEVLYDLDTEARQLCAELGLNMVRAGTAGGDPRFAAMIRELVLEQIDERKAKQAAGTQGPWPDTCPPGCCVVPPRPGSH